MHPEDIDDLFRQQLEGHSTPPAHDLWARLQSQFAASGADAPGPERLDHLFRQELNNHATPPNRELWERLEDEHLRPKKRRTAAWWPMALAAAVAMLLVAGGAGLWLGFPLGKVPVGTLATRPSGPTPEQGRDSTPAVGTNARPGTAAEELAVIDNATESAASALPSGQKKISTAQATHIAAVASTAPKARMSVPEQSPRYQKGVNRWPDAALVPAPLVARTATRSTNRPDPATPADEQVPVSKSEPVVANNSKPAPAPEIVPANAVPASEIITVDVRNGGAPEGNRNTSLAAAMEAPNDRRRLGHRLLQQAGNFVRGERVSLAEATGLPQNVTVHATIAGRTLTKSIQL